MNEIFKDYTINPQTFALLPAKQIDYETTVIEQDKQFFVSKTPYQLIKEACLDYYSTYEGRRTAVMHHTNFKKKVPIPISLSRNIYAFPTHSTTDIECIWIFPNHIQSIKQVSSVKTPHFQSVITFKNGQQLPLNVSHHILDKQMQRATICMFQYASFTEFRTSFKG